MPSLKSVLNASDPRCLSANDIVPWLRTSYAISRVRDPSKLRIIAATPQTQPVWRNGPFRNASRSRVDDRRKFSADCRQPGVYFSIRLTQTFRFANKEKAA